MILVLGFGRSGAQAQTTSLTFSAIPTTDPDLIAPGRGAELWNSAFWNDVYAVMVPAGNATTLDKYYRFNWFDIEPTNTTQGSYNWSIFDAQIQAAIDAGQKFSFGVMPVCGGCSPTVAGGEMSYPLYLHNQMQAESTKDWLYSGSWVPNWNSPSYLAAWENLLNAIASHIANGSYKGIKYSNVIHYVDVRGYGNWGEWHTYPWYGNEPSGTLATSATLKRIIDSHKTAFPNYPLVIIMGAYDGGNASNIPADVSYYALTTSNAWGQIGWRRDNWGDPGYDGALANNPTVFNGTALNSLIVNKYKFAPVVGEPLNDQNAISKNGASCMHYDLEREVRLYHATSFGNGNYPNVSNQCMRDNVIAASKASGYRLVLTGGSTSTSITAGSGLAVTLNWQNIGIAPTYEDWDIVYELRSSTGTVVWSGTSAFKLKLFNPSTTATAATDNFTMPSSIVSGTTYGLYVVIRDPNGYRKPLPLAITGRNSDGSYLLRNITAGTASTTPPTTTPPATGSFTVSAGSNQTLAAGTTTANLAGSYTEASDSAELIVIWGESNADGYGENNLATPAEAQARTRTRIMNPTTGNWENYQLGVNSNLGGYSPDPANQHSFDLELANLVDSGRLKSPTVYVVKMGGSGSYISQWLPGSSRGLFEEMTPRLDSAVAKLNRAGVKFRMSVFQTIGLNDRFGQGTTVDSFLNRLSRFRAAFRARYNRPNIPFIMTEFFNGYEWNSNFEAIKLTDPLVRAVPTDGAAFVPGMENVHWGYQGFKFITRRMVDTLLTTRGWRIGWSQVSGPNTATIVNPTYPAGPVQGLVNGTYVFRLTAANLPSGSTATGDVQIVVGTAAPNKAPLVTAGNAISVTLPANTATLTGTATDSDGTIASYAWTKVSGPASGTLTTPNAATTTVTGLVAGTYVFKLTATDNGGATGSANITVTVSATPNIVPTVTPGAAVTITLPTSTATVTATATDVDGTIAGLTWTQVSGPATATIASPTAASTSISGLTVAGSYVFKITATDNIGATASGNVTVTVNTGANVAPTANAGTDITITLPVNSTTLSGSGKDNDGTIASYAWTKVSGPAGGTIASPKSAATNITGLLAGTYVYRLTVTDDRGATATDNVNVIVNAAPTSNQAPTASAGSNITLTLPTNSTTLSGSGSDADGTIATYAWSQLSGPSAASIAKPAAASTGISGLIEGTYTFRLTVTDNGGLSATSDVQVTVNAAPSNNGVNRLPVANAGQDQTLTLPVNSTSLNGSASSDPDGSIASYSWSQLSGPTTATLGSKGSVSTTVSNLVKGTYQFQLTVSDDKNATSTAKVLVIVTDANQMAVIKFAADTIDVTLPVTNTELNATASYDPDGTIASYAWSYVSGPGTPDILAPTAARTTVNNLVAGTYEFSLAVTDNKGAVTTRKTVVVVSYSNTRIANQAFAIYPNPVQSTANISLNSDMEGKAVYQVTDMNGRPLLTGEFTKVSGSQTLRVDMNNLRPGVYFLKLQVNDVRVGVKKLMKL